ncbi:candidapepsin [[Candida] zeylanoides]
MSFFSSLLTIASLCLGGALAAPTDGLTKRAPGVIGLEFDVHISENFTVLERRGDYDAQLQNKGTYYITYLNFGSNKQSIGVDVDTGSSDLWVPDASLSGQAVAKYGTYNPSSSTTSKNTGKVFAITYADYSSTSGKFYTDSVGFDGITLKDFQFADTTTAAIANGILGIGPLGSEAEQSNQGTYPNFPIALKNAGYINKAAYSLYLNTASASTGSVLFGGKDLAKIDGGLVTLQHSGSIAQLSVTLNSISGLKSRIPVNAPYVLDSGTTINYFDTATFNALKQQLGFTGSYYDRTRPYVSCTQTGSFNFEFNGITISVPLSEIVLNAGSGRCVANIGNIGNNILGDLFLRHAYLVYNLEDESVQIGKVKYTTDTNIVAL